MSELDQVPFIEEDRAIGWSWLPEVMEPLSSEQIEAERPAHWEYRLTVARLKAGLEPLALGLERKWERSTCETDLAQFARWVIDRLETQTRWAQEVSHLGNRLMAAWGPAGTEGDVEAIKEAVDDIVRFCHTVLGMFRDVSPVQIAGFELVHEALATIARKVFSVFERMVVDIYRIYSHPTGGPHAITIEISIDPEIDMCCEVMTKAIQEEQARLPRKQRLVERSKGRTAGGICKRRGYDPGV